MKVINIPYDQIKRTTLAASIYYDKLEIDETKVVGYQDGQQAMTWYFKSYIGIDFVKANMNSQFAQVVFLTGVNSNNRFVGIDFYGVQNAAAMKDTNKILFCSGMFSFGKTNDYAAGVFSEIKKAFDNYNANKEKYENSPNGANAFSAADELKKFKELLDMGIISHAEFEAKKKQLLIIQKSVVIGSQICIWCGKKPHKRHYPQQHLTFP